MSATAERPKADPREVLSDLVAAARAAGADAADAMMASGASLSVGMRLGEVEAVERSEGFDIGLRVFLGRRQAVVSTTDADPGGFAALAERAVAMARAVPEDPFGSLPESVPPLGAAALDMDDGVEPDVAALTARARRAEEAARAVSGVTNSEGADAGWHCTVIALAASNGFAGTYSRSGHSLSVTALAGEGTAMERDYDLSSATHLSDLDDPETLGRNAGERAVRRLNPIRPATARLPVLLDPRVAGSILGHLVSAANGAAVARGTSFLRERMGQKVMASGLTLRDDPTRPRGPRSRPFDAEGMPTAPLSIVEDGVLRHWLLDWRSARQLGMQSNGRASRSVGGPPSPSTTNLWLEPGAMTPEALMADIKEGLLVTEMIGSSINALTGDYSRGASGFMIRDGKVAEPFSGVTLAGNLLDMFLNITPANDLRFRHGTDSPTLRIEGLTMAGG
ncbi:TldD/PmbA family protein [Muricoccus pecuniae]|uniref:PmbA protein n=1 Tax=Muricoccus pecuniae TaxID=693023 RepID=A0A840Y200_9PROT|nr:TldD/PmbA family protein [Roseomonas pecuniae]MBB5695138.1 PmbA protein [Roseomonas pecuniae]